MNRAVFLDRDGTLVVEKNYLSDSSQVEIFPGAPEALKRLQDAGFKLFIVTNQSGIGRGYYTLEDMHRVNARLLEELARRGVQFEKIYFAPEAPEAPSRGRKPSPQFLFDARDEFGIDLTQSYMIGDKLIDLECGWNAGVRKSILVRTGYGAQTERSIGEELDRVRIVDDLTGASEWILCVVDIEDQILKALPKLSIDLNSWVRRNLIEPTKVQMVANPADGAVEEFWLVTKAPSESESYQIVYHPGSRQFGLGGRGQNGKLLCIGLYGEFDQTVQSL